MRCQWVTLMWIGSWCFSVHFSIGDPLINGNWDAMLCTIFEFFTVGHPLGVNEWIKLTVAEAVVHGIREQYER